MKNDRTPHSKLALIRMPKLAVVVGVADSPELVEATLQGTQLEEIKNVEH